MEKNESGDDLFKQVFEISPNIITITSFEQGIFMEVNPAFELITGYSREEVIGKSAIDIQIWADTDFRKNTVRELIENKVVSKQEARFRRKDGSIRLFRASAKTITYNNRLCILGFSEDISLQKEKEQSFNKTIDNLPLGIFRSSVDGKMLSANLATAKIYGYNSIDEILNRTATDFYTNDSDREIMLDKLTKQRTLLNYITLEKKKDGSKIWVSTNYKASYNKNNKLEFIDGIVEDITERKEMEESLHESEERFRELFENNHTILVLINPEKKIIIEGNAAAADFYGCSVEQLKNISLYDCMSDSPKTIDTEIHRIKKGKEVHLNAEIIIQNGSLRETEIYSGFIKTMNGEIMYAFIYDLTEESIARKKTEIFDKAINQSSSCVLITDKNGTIEYVNTAFTRITGYSKEEAIGQNPRILKSGMIEEQTYKDLWSTILSGKSWSGELINKRKTGEIYWEKATISPILNQRSKITKFIAIKDDITEQKKLIHDLVVAKEKAEESNKLKSAFLANMSHEIRTPLNSIIGFTELFFEENLSKEQQGDFKRYIYESTDQLLSVVNDVLDMSLISTQQIQIFNETFDINTFITEVSANFEKSVKNKGLQFNTTIALENGICQITSDFKKLRQIFEKLFNNAIKYTQEGEITFGYEYTDEFIRLFISDTGVGIPRERQDLIYESFSQGSNELTRKFGGLGLGLTIAKRFSELLGVDIQFYSKPNKGTTFSVLLPNYSFNILSVDNSSLNDTNTIAKSLGAAKIMIVEDDIPSFEYLKFMLERYGLQIIHIQSGNEVLSCYKKHEDIQLVIMDIRIPHLDGWQATKLLKNYNPKLPVIALSAYANDGDMQRAQLSGANMFLTKPTRPEVLLKHIIDLIS